MIIKINENISYWREYNPIELSVNDIDINDSRRVITKLGFNNDRISIMGRWFDVISPSELVRKTNKKDGYYRVIYIQLNWKRYYIGKRRIAPNPKLSAMTGNIGVKN